MTAFDYVEALFRLVFIRTGRKTTALAVVREVILSAFEQAGYQLAAMDFEKLFQTALEWKYADSSLEASELSGWLLALHRLPEPTRSVLVLFYLEVLEPAAAARVATVSLEQFATLVSTGRRLLAADLSTAPAQPA